MNFFSSVLKRELAIYIGRNNSVIVIGEHYQKLYRKVQYILAEFQQENRRWSDEEELVNSLVQKYSKDKNKKDSDAQRWTNFIRKDYFVIQGLLNPSKFDPTSEIGHF